MKFSKKKKKAEITSCKIAIIAAYEISEENLNKIVKECSKEITIEIKKTYESFQMNVLPTVYFNIQSPRSNYIKINFQ